MKYFIFIFMSFGVFADDFYMVDSPDVAQGGWYWEPDGAGWGLNMSIQPTEDGFYLQGAAYTYDENGQAFWYTFQNPYIPNEDVYAWREGRGLMGSFQSLLAESSNGGCIDCPHVGNGVAASDKGTIKLEWIDPLHVKMIVNGVSKDLKHFYFHKGLNVNNIDFITEKVWFIHGANSFDVINSRYNFFKGTAKFEPLPQSVRDSIVSNSGHLFEFEDSYTWYVMNNHVLESFYNINGSVFEDGSSFGVIYDTFLLLGFDKSNGEAVVYTGNMENFGSANYWISTCLREPKIKSSFRGLFRPGVAQTTRLYYNDNDSMSQCDDVSGHVDWKRQQFIDLTSMPTGGADLKEVSVMFDRFKTQ